MNEGKKDIKPLHIAREHAKIVGPWAIRENVIFILKVECTERPRKVVAAYTNQNIAADDLTK